MAEAVSGARAPISQTIPDPTRRARLRAAPAAAIGIGPLPRRRSPPPDADLFAKEPGIQNFIAKWSASLDAYGEAETLYYAEAPEKPVRRDAAVLAAYEAECDRLRAKYNVDALEDARPRPRRQHRDVLATIRART